jgi:hypothetical protein
MSIYEYPDLWFPGVVEMEAYPDIERSPYAAMLSDDDLTMKSDIFEIWVLLFSGIQM